MGGSHDGGQLPRSADRTPERTQAPVRDVWRRALRDLRVSLTDRCNLRCPYCMPQELFGADHVFLRRAEQLTPEELEAVVRAAVTLGVRKVRLTGGEPLLRPEVVSIVERLAQITGLDDLALTTNGLLLERLAAPLRQAGLGRVTVSLDALDEPTFRAMSGGLGESAKVLAGLAAAVSAGYPTIKVNTVVRRGINEHAVRDVATRFRHTGVEVRFIELMDVGGPLSWSAAEVVSEAEIVAQLRELGPLEPSPREPIAAEVTSGEGSGAVAHQYRWSDGGGTVGIVASVTSPFCGSCSRLRLTADGQLHTCLFSTKGHDLRRIVRQEHQPGALHELIRDELSAVWQRRVDRYSEQRAHLSSAPVGLVAMSRLGG